MFDPDQTAALLETLGLPPETDDPALVVATVVDLVAQAAAVSAERPATVAAAARAIGMEVAGHRQLDCVAHSGR